MKAHDFCDNKFFVEEISHIENVHVRNCSIVLLQTTKSTNACSSIGFIGEELRETQLQNAIPYEKIPGPKPLPLVGNTWRFLPYIGDYKIRHIDKVSVRLYKEYGSVVKISGLLGKPDLLFLYDPSLIEQVFRHEDSMPLRPSMPSLNYYKHVYRKDFFGENAGVIAVHGENWQKFRSKVSKIMLQPKTVNLYIQPIERIADEFVRNIHKLKNENEEMPDNFLNEIHKWSLEGIGKIALDVRLGCLDDYNSNSSTQELIDAMTTFFVNVPILELKFPFWRFFNTPTFKKYLNALDTITEFTKCHANKALEDINKTSKKDEHCSIFKKLLQNEKDAKIATALALDMFLVGIDTTSNAVASILYQLSINQDKQQKLHEQITSVLGKDEDVLLNAEKLEKLTYLKACIKETMRMYPVVIGNGRCISRDCVIGGYHVPKGVQVVFQHYVIGNLDHFFSESERFLPERWLKLDDQNFRRHHQFASLPFGFGKRMCLGRRFSELEMQILIAKIIKTFRVEYHHKKLQYHVHPMYTPDGPLKLRFINKN